ncbi:uncharacterized protein METZ01_LOCUS325796, partial [marine metagenome]
VSPVVITEAKTLHGVDLSDEEAERLNRAGRRLVGGPWWRDGDEERDRKVVECVRGEDGWDIEAGNVIGVIGLGERALHIRPKIPLRHLMYLLGEAGVIPRIDKYPAEVQRDAEFVEVVAGWFINTVHQLVRLGLHRDYEEIEDETSAVQGQLMVPPTSLNLYAGRPYFTCRFDEYTFDNPPNRVISEALGRLQRIQGLDDKYRRRARGLLAEFPATGSMRHGDLRYRPDRNAMRYETPLELARQIIDSTGRRPEPGQDTAMGFLIPTPTNVEKGLRNVLRQLLPEGMRLAKGAKRLPGGVKVEPDLVFGANAAVGDIKYRIFDEKWVRNEFFQLT